MRNAPVALKNWLAANRVGWRADLITLTLIDGTTKYRWTNADVSITTGGFTYSAMGASAPLLKRGAYSQGSRLTVDTLTMDLVGGSFFLIGGKTLAQLVTERYFAGARVQIDHLIGPDLPGALALGAIPSFFEGRVCGIETHGPAVVMTLKSELIALNVLQPKFPLQVQCGNAVYDVNCGLNKATFTLTGSASGAPTRSTIPTTTAGLTAKAAGYFDLGVMVFTSGVNNGLRRAVQIWSGTVFTMALPFPTAPAAGDTFTIYPGCDRSKLQCGAAKFNNLAQYRGYPHIPSPEAA